MYVMCVYTKACTEYGLIVVAALQAVWYWTALGYKVLGFVAGRVSAESQQDLTKINLRNIRQHAYGMRMLGFAVISNPLRNDSTAAITELQDRYACSRCG